MRDKQNELLGSIFLDLRWVQNVYVHVLIYLSFCVLLLVGEHNKSAISLV